MNRQTFMSEIPLEPTNINTPEISMNQEYETDRNGFRQQPSLAARLLTELIGTGLFIFFGAGCAAKAKDLLTPAAAHGGVALWLIYIFGPVSGAHFNAGATIAFAIDGKMKPIEIIGYLISQCFGALIAGALLLWLYGTESSLGTPALGPGATVMHGFAIEFLCPVILSFVIFFTTTYHSHKECAFSIGLVVFSSFLLGGDVDGAALNPWRWLGPAVASRTFRAEAWIYWTGPITGFVFGYLFFRCYQFIWNKPTAYELTV